MDTSKNDLQGTVTGVEVQLTGVDGNAFNILGLVDKKMRRAGVSQEVRDKYRAEATSGDYDHLLQVTMKFVIVS